MKTGYEDEFERYFALFETHGYSKCKKDAELTQALEGIVYHSQWSALQLLDLMSPCSLYRIPFYDDCNDYYEGFYKKYLEKINEVENCRLVVSSVKEVWKGLQLDLVFKVNSEHRSLRIPKVGIEHDTVPPAFIDTIDEVLLNSRFDGYRFVKLERATQSHYDHFYYMTFELEQALVDLGELEIENGMPLYPLKTDIRRLLWVVRCAIKRLVGAQWSTLMRSLRKLNCMIQSKFGLSLNFPMGMN